MPRIYLRTIVTLQRRQNAVIALRFVVLGTMLLLAALLLFHALYSFPGLLPVAVHGRVMFLLALGGKITVALLLLYLAVVAGRRMLSPLQAARLLDVRRADAADLFQNALQLADQPSPIVERLLNRADAATADTRPDTRDLRRLLPALAALLLALAFTAALQPAALADSWRFLRLRSIPGVAHKATVEVEPGNVTVMRGNDLTIRVLHAEEGAPHSLFTRLADIWRQQPLPGGAIMLPDVDTPFDYYVATPWACSDTFRVEVFEEPAVRRLSLALDYPPHTGLKREVLDDSDGQISALAGTRAQLSIEANHDLAEARLLFADGAVADMQRLGRASFETDFTLQASGSYRIQLKDVLGNESTGPVKTIRVTPDNPPEVRITVPGRDTTLTQNMRTRLRVAASDDFGLSDLDLHWQVNDGQEQFRTLLKGIRGNGVEHDDLFDLTTAGLIPGDRVLYWVTVLDNSPATQRGESRHYLLRLPSIEEIYQQIEQEERNAREDLQQTLEQSRELSEDFEEKRREVMKQEQTDWADRDELEKMMQRQEGLSENVQDLAQQYQQLIENMEQNQALSPETLEKMQKIQQLMEEIDSDELRQAMEQMRTAMENMDQDALRQAMEQMRFNMQDFAEKLDRTIDLLESIKQEQAVEKARQIAEEMEQMQSDLREQTADAKNDPRDLADRQESLNDKLDALQKQLDRADSLLADQEQLREMMDQLQEMMQSDSLRHDMEQAANNMKQGNRRQAMQNQQSAQQKMQQMLAMLTQMKQSMQSGAMGDMTEALKKAANRMLTISGQHKEICARYVDDPYPVAGGLLACWEGIQNTLRDLYANPMIMLYLHPKFPSDQARTAAAYRNVFQQINDARYSGLRNLFTEIQAGINLMAYDLMQSMSSMSQNGGMSGGMESMMQALQQMSRQQMAMNMLTQQMMEQMMQNGGRMTPDMRGQMGRMADEEERLAENLRRMLQNEPGAYQQGSSLQKTAEELEAIARELRRGRMDADLADRQERILSRLLEAQKSVHQREYSRKRQAETSKQQEWENPAELRQHFDTLRRRALLDEGYKTYPSSYQDVIKEYLRRLNEEAGGE